MTEHNVIISGILSVKNEKELEIKMDIWSKTMRTYLIDKWAML